MENTGIPSGVCMNNIQEATNKNTIKDTLKCDQRRKKSYQHYFLSSFLKVRKIKDKTKQNEVSPKGGRKYSYPNTPVLISASTDTFSGMGPMGFFFSKRKHLTFLKAKGGGEGDKSKQPFFHTSLKKKPFPFKKYCFPLFFQQYTLVGKAVDGT